MDLIRKTGIEDVKDLRSDYLDGLCQPEELYSEIMMRDSIPHVIMVGSEEAGYALVGTENVLLEFHLRERFIPEALEIFKRVIKDLKIEKAVCQSFDHLYLSMCVLHMKERKILGYHFRDRIEPLSPVPEFDLNVRTATIEDVDLIMKYRDEIFEDDEIDDIPYYIDIGSIMIFEQDDGSFIGYGILNRTLPDRNWFDIGMYVKPEFRKKGYGTFFIDRMADLVTGMGGRPTAGCDIENVGSKRTLERAGFISKHVMIEFGF